MAFEHRWLGGVGTFLSSTLYEVLDSPDALVEVAEWESADAQAAGVEHALASGVYAPVVELVAAPFEATRLGQPTYHH